MKAELYEKETPVTVENFVNLAGKRFYDGLTFHCVIPDFVIPVSYTHLTLPTIRLV